jgi:hypothetical protein
VRWRSYAVALFLGGAFLVSVVLLGALALHQR